MPIICAWYRQVRFMKCCPLTGLTCLWGKEAAGGADALTQNLDFWFGLRAQRHRQEVVEVDWMSLTLGQAGQAAARRLQAFLLQDLADAGVHAWGQNGQMKSGDPSL